MASSLVLVVDETSRARSAIAEETSPPCKADDCRGQVLAALRTPDEVWECPVCRMNGVIEMETQQVRSKPNRYLRSPVTIWCRSNHVRALIVGVRNISICLGRQPKLRASCHLWLIPDVVYASGGGVDGTGTFPSYLVPLFRFRSALRQVLQR